MWLRSAELPDDTCSKEFYGIDRKLKAGFGDAPRCNFTLKYFIQVAFDVFRDGGIAEPAEEPEEEGRRLYRSIGVQFYF